MRNGILIATLALLPAAGLAFAEPPVGEGLVEKSRPTLVVSDPPASSHAGPVKNPAATSTSASDGGSCPSGAGCCLPCDTCARTGRQFWGSAEYLLWWIKDSRLPPLVTAGPPGSSAVLGQPGTTILFGGSDLEHEEFSGGRFIFGFGLDDCNTIGLESEYFFLVSRSADFTASATGAAGTPVIARPLVNALTGNEISQLVFGTVGVSSPSRLWGAEENLVWNVCCGCCSRLDLLVGFRYLQLDEGLDIRESVLVPATIPTFAGTSIRVSDEFGDHNHFYGGQIGARSERRWGNLFASAWGKVALGETHETLRISGATLIAQPGFAAAAQPGGILALPTNIGHFSRDEFAVVPEVGIHVGYQLSDHLRAFVGYSFLYWSDVARPGDQIDRVINPTQIPSSLTPGTLVGPARPAASLRDTDFWAQGISFGLEFRY